MSRKGAAGESFSSWIRSPQTLIGLSAVLLSVCGLFISIYEASLIRRAQRASVWPYVQVAASVNPDSATVWVQNSGVGPARVEAAALTYEGERLEGWMGLIRRVAEDEASLDYYQSQINGRVLAANAEREDLFAVSADSGAAAQAVVRRLGAEILKGTIDVEVCYCSVYDECWVSSLKDLTNLNEEVGAAPAAREVKRCTALQRSGI